MSDPSGSKAPEWLEGLRSAENRDAVLNAVWDLRDDAYDHPESWDRLTAVRLLHYMADHVESTADDVIDWGRFGSLLGAAIADARSDAASNWDG